LKHLSENTGEKRIATEENKRKDEARIRELLDDWVESLRSKSIERVMSIYAQELVAFDIVPPLQYVGADVYRKPWEEVFSAFQGPIDYEIHGLNITMSDDVAFTHSLNRISGTMNNERSTDLWVRCTACFRKINGKGLIAHLQVSVPVDLESGKAVLDLKP
jgi:ketosteroid isomerase-like protein